MYRSVKKVVDKLAGIYKSIKKISKLSKMSKIVKKKKVKLVKWSFRSRTRSRRKRKSREEEEEGGDDEEEEEEKEEDGRRKRRKRGKKRRKKIRTRSKRHRKGKIYSLKAFTPRTFLLTIVLSIPMYSCLVSTSLLIFS